MRGITFYSPHQFAAFRILFGCYLAWSFASVIPYAPELFGDTPVGHTEATLAFPDILSLADGFISIQLFLGGLVMLAILFALGILRRVVALLIWYGIACLSHQNSAILNVSLPYVGWMLLACALIPSGEPLRFGFRTSTTKWQMPPIIFYGAWIVMAVTYSISGYSKLDGVQWLDGTAISQLMHFPGARDWWLTRAMQSLPPAMGYVITWSVLYAELGFVVLCLHRWGRALAWAILTGTHVGILLIMTGPEVQLALLLFHLFTFDQRWLSELRTTRNSPSRLASA